MIDDDDDNDDDTAIAAHQLSSHFISSHLSHLIQLIFHFNFLQYSIQFNYPHLISLVASTYARTRKPEDQGDIFSQRKTRLTNKCPLRLFYKSTSILG